MSEIALYRNISTGKLPIKNYEALKGAMPAVMLYDATDKAPFESAFNFTIADYKRFPLLSDTKMKFFFEETMKWTQLNPTQRQLWFNAGYCVLLYFMKNPDHDFYWSIEYDCWFNGMWKDFFELYKNDKSDFLGPLLKDTTNTESKLEKAKLIRNFDYPKIYNSFGCIHRYSNRLLKEVIKALKEKHYAFYETLFPTVAANSNMSVRDLNDIPKEPVYTDSSLLRASTTTYQLIHFAGGANKLWHRVR